MTQRNGDQPLRSAPIPSVSYVPGGSANIHMETAGRSHARAHTQDDDSDTHPRLSKSLSMPAHKNEGRAPLSARTTAEHRRPPTVSRAQSVRDVVTSNMGTFFGVATTKTRGAVEDGPDPQEVRQRSKWENRRLRHCSRRYGAIKTPIAARGDVDFSDQIIGQLQTPGPIPPSARFSQASTSERPFPTPRKFISAPAASHLDSTLVDAEQPLSVADARRLSTTSTMNRSVSHDSKAHVKIVQRRESVYKMAWDGFTTLLTRGTPRPRESYASAQRKARLRSHSFTPGSIAADDSVFESEDILGQPLDESGDSANLSVLSSSAGLKFDMTPMATIAEEGAASRKGSTAALREAAPAAPPLPERGSSRSPPPLPPRLRISPSQRRDTSEYRPDSLDIDDVDIPLHVLQTADLRHDAEPSTSMVEREEVDGPPPPPPEHRDLDSTISLQDDVFFDVIPHHYHVRFPSRDGREPSHYHVTKVGLPKHGRRQRTPERGTAQASRLPEYPPVQMGAAGDTGTLSSAIAVFDEPIAKPTHVRHEHGAIKGIYSGQAPQPPPHRQGVRQVKHRKKPPADLRVKTSVSTPEPTEWSLQNIWNKVGHRLVLPPFVASVLHRRISIFILFLVAFLSPSKIFTPSNSDRRQYGEGIIGKLFGRRLKRRRHLPDHVLKQLDDYDDFRPFFTYWVTTVQVLVLILSLILYGFAPFGFFGRRQITEKITHRTLIKQQVAYLEQENFWVGPRFADLIHLGAKFSPCMRPDRHIYDVINADRRTENSTACCIYNDRSGCFQATEEQCPESLAVHHKWSLSNSPNGRTSGSVCGQDPEACREPPSISPYEWPDDITRWPICTKSAQAELLSLPQLTCDLTGRPCCIGIHGQCRITTRDYCDFVRGYFHDDATLCSQVSCMSEVCGMLPFFSTDTPDQWYRLFISLFIHAGFGLVFLVENTHFSLIHLLTTVLIQMVFMRDFEKLIGWERMAIIYILSGMAGYLASATFVPNIPEVGPAGSHFGLLAGMFADLWHSRKLLEHPWHAFAQLAVVTALLFLIGFFPWVDNWAHLFGFITGLFLSLAVFPYIQFDDEDPKAERRKRLILVCW